MTRATISPCPESTRPQGRVGEDAEYVGRPLRAAPVVERRQVVVHALEPARGPSVLLA